MKLKSLIPYFKEEISANSFEYRFTVFTPVYNRAKTIHRVFNSLNNQTFKDFELVIINDGSKDNSHEVILDLIKTATFKVNYINNSENKHKMGCFVQAIELAKGEFMLPLDSDDECTGDALEIFNNTYINIPDNLKDKISSVTALCKDQFGNLVGEKFEVSPYFSSTFQNMLDNKYDKEKWGFTKTDVLKHVVINPELYAKGYIPEGILWCLLSKSGYQTCYFNSVLRIYYIDENDQNISSGSFKNNALGLAVYSLSILNWFQSKFFKNPKLFLKWIYYLLLSSKHLSYNRVDYSKALDSWFFKLVFIAFWPIRKQITKG